MFGLKPSKLTEFCGWYGVFALILAYALASFGIIVASGIVYQLLNLSGAIGLMIVAMSKRVAQSVFINIIWIIIGIIVITKLIFQI